MEVKRIEVNGKEYDVYDDGTIRSVYFDRKLTYVLSNSGYHQVSIGGKLRTVHKVIYETFIGTVPNGYDINHIDEDKLNNKLSNLSILTHKDNCNYGSRNKKISDGHAKMGYFLGIDQYDENGNFIKHYDSYNEINKDYPNAAGNVCKCCQGNKRYSKVKGYIWKLTEKQ